MRIKLPTDTCVMCESVLFVSICGYINFRFHFDVQDDSETAVHKILSHVLTRKHLLADNFAFVFVVLSDLNRLQITNCR